VTVYATFTFPAVKVDVVEIAKAAVIVNVREAVAVALAVSVTVTLKLEAPDLVGVPLNKPAELSVNPAGNVPLETVQLVYGAVPPLAARVCKYATLILPEGKVEVVIAKVADVDG
jgi:hypothetical protein